MCACVGCACVCVSVCGGMCAMEVGCSGAGTRLVTCNFLLTILCTVLVCDHKPTIRELQLAEADASRSSS